LKYGVEMEMEEKGRRTYVNEAMEGKNTTLGW